MVVEYGKRLAKDNTVIQFFWPLLGEVGFYFWNIEEAEACNTEYLVAIWRIKQLNPNTNDIQTSIRQNY